MPPARRFATSDRAGGGQNTGSECRADSRALDGPLRSADGRKPRSTPRHQTLRTTIDWSHDLLTSRDQTILRRLSMFASKFTLEDVEAVCTSEDMAAANALDCLSSLVDRSLVMKEEANNLACYRLHETMREYAALKLR